MSTDATLGAPYPSQRIVVLRHGERRDSAPNAPVESNPPLTEAGVAAVKTVAARLVSFLGNDAARSAVLVVSPFLRTLQTAEALQHYGVGVSQSMVVDNTMCEVFGPSRINTSSPPKLQAPAMTSPVGGLPPWGESIEMATERYVANFLRIGDLYGGRLVGCSPLTDGLLGTVDTLPTSTTVVQGVVTKCNTSRLPPRKVIPRSSINIEGKGSSSLSDASARDVVVVTHGDAISAVLSHFYPARLVYETEFLSFVIMRRCGVGNHVYHLDTSSGVSWLVEGVDLEPNDPIMLKLEKQRLGSEGASDVGQRSRGSDRGSNLDDDDVVDDTSDVPVSLVRRRMHSCTSSGAPDHSCVGDCASSFLQNGVSPPTQSRDTKGFSASTTNGLASGALSSDKDLEANSSSSSAQAHRQHCCHHEKSQSAHAMQHQSSHRFCITENASVASEPLHIYPKDIKCDGCPPRTCQQTEMPKHPSRHGSAVINSERNVGHIGEDTEEGAQRWRCSGSTVVYRELPRGKEARHA